MSCILPHDRGYLPTENQMATKMMPRNAKVAPKTAHCTEDGALRSSTTKAGNLGSGGSVGAIGTGSGVGGRATSGKGDGPTGDAGATWLDAPSATSVAAAHKAS